MRITRLGWRHTGRPSVQPRLNIISISSSASATSIRREPSTLAPNRTRVSTRSGSTLIEPHPGRISEADTEPGDAGDPFPVGPVPADRAFLLDTVDHPEHRRHRLDLVVPADRQVGPTPQRVIRERGVVLGEDRQLHGAIEPRSTGTIILQVSHSCLTTTTIPSGSAAGDVATVITGT